MQYIHVNSWSTYCKLRSKRSIGEIFMCLFYKNLLNNNLVSGIGKILEAYQRTKLVMQSYKPFINEHTSSSEKGINRNTRKAGKSSYTISISISTISTDLCNKCLKFLEHLGVIGTKKAGKINQSKR